MTTDRPTIRAARAGDAAGIAAVFATYVTASVATFETVPPAPERWAERIASLQDAGMPFLVMTSPDEVIGYAYAAQWRTQSAYRHTVETTIYLGSGHTGRGYGKLLLDALLARCRESGMRQAIAVIADTGNAASIALHRSAGFDEVGRLTAVGHKHDRWIDTVLLQRALG